MASRDWASTQTTEPDRGVLCALAAGVVATWANYRRQSQAAQ
jgi:hypothetical protein